MKRWDIKALRVSPHRPEVLSTSDEGRAIVLEIPAGESLNDHEVHERAWVIVIDGDVDITTAAGGSVSGGSGLMAEFDPSERHAVHARSTARLLLLLTPWPGRGHPRTMTLEDKRPSVQ